MKGIDYMKGYVLMVVVAVLAPEGKSHEGVDAL